jgi:pimeloyl-ACP methyl ester carboxylesterase
VLDLLSIDFMETLSMAMGADALAAAEAVFEEPGYILIYEGSVMKGWDGNALLIGGKTGLKELDLAAPNAAAIVAVGSCAVDGGFVPLVSASAVDQTLRDLDVDLTGALRGSDVPMLLVRGGDSTFVSPRAFATSLALRAGLRGAVVPGVDHFVPEEAPLEVAALVRELLRG